MGQRQSVTHKTEVRHSEVRRRTLSRPKEVKTIFANVDEQTQSIFSLLPIEIVEELFSYFSDEHLGIARLVCKRWNLCAVRSEVSKFSKFVCRKD